MEQVELSAGTAAQGLTWPTDSSTQWGNAHLPGSTDMQGSAGGGAHQQPDASRVAFLEAGLKSTQSHNVNLQHHMAFLQAQMIHHLGHITKLQTRVRALESELASLTANPRVGATPAPGSSEAVGAAAASPVAAGTTPPLSPASAPAHELHRPLPGQQREPTPPNPAAHGVVGNQALWDLRPKGADGSGTALTAPGQGERGAMPPEATAQAAQSPSPPQAQEPAAKSSPCALDDARVDPSEDPTSTHTAPTEASSTAAAVTASVTPRHPLHDFWADNSPPASNTRNRGLRGDSTCSKSSLPNGHVASDRVDKDREQQLEPVHDPPEPTCKAALTPVLWCATEGREGAEDRSSHLMDCALCQGPLPEDDSIARCGACPRSFCAPCLEHALRDQGADLEGLDQDGRAMLGGERGDFFVEQCPHCIRGCDKSFAAPSPGAAPMEHLLNELLRHDLSICFREPVDTEKHPDYVESIGRDAMMDLGTMLDKLKRKRYPRRRGPGQFLEDLNRIWRNCRKYAGCDELGQPHYGATVPGIVRCALILEAMSITFCAAHMSDNQGTHAWQESTWDFHRERQERMNAEARLEQLKNQGKTSGNKKATPRESSGVGGQYVNVASKQECRGGSRSKRSAVGRSRREEHGKPGDDNNSSDSCSVIHAAEDSSGGGRKRSAAEMEGAALAESSNARGHSAARTMLEANDANSGGTPTILIPSAAKTPLQRPPWSPLDKLCDLATSFQK